MKRTALGLLLVLGALFPAGARAFSDPEAFGNPVEDAGGGGRWFTGSAADGYTCKVCHRGAPSPSLEILGLPLEGYLPGISYEITIDWPDTLENAALTAEITNGQGTRAGSLRLPPQNELREEELCLPVGAGLGAGEVVELPTRSVLSVPDCGARRVRMLWTAPVQDEGPVWFSGSLVSADAHGDVEGDGVRDFAHVIGSPSAPDALSAKIASGCTALPSRHGSPWLAALAALALLAWRRRRRARG